MLGSKPGDARRVVAPSGASHRHPTTETSTREDHGVDVREIVSSEFARVPMPHRRSQPPQDGHQQASEGAPGDSVGHQVRRHRGGPGRQPRAHAGHAQGCVTLGPPPPFSSFARHSCADPSDPDPTFRAPAIRPASRSHTKPSTVDLTSDPSNHSSTAGPEESPYEGGKFYVSHPPDRPSHHKSPLLASAFSSTCFLNKSPHR